MVLGWDLPHRPVMPVRGGEQRSLVAAARAVEEARKVLRDRAVASWFLPGPDIGPDMDGTAAAESPRPETPTRRG